MKKPSRLTAAKQSASARPGFQPSAAAKSIAIEISSGRMVRMHRSFIHYSACNRVTAMTSLVVLPANKSLDERTAVLLNWKSVQEAIVLCQSRLSGGGNCIGCFEPTFQELASLS